MIRPLPAFAIYLRTAFGGAARASSLALATAGLLGLAACPSDPYSYETWTKQLGDEQHMERAVTELEQLGQPGAIPALGTTWAKKGKPVRLLQVIISLARPLTPEEAKAKFVVDYEKTGRKASWSLAMPFLTQALVEIDSANPRSVDSAAKAADALGDAQLGEGLDALIEMAQKPIDAKTKKIISAQISAIKALGKFDNEHKTKAATALMKLIDREPERHPKTAKDKEEGRALEEKFGLYLGITGAAINALGELRVPTASKTLALSMYRTPELFVQIRRALVATGPTAKDDLKKILRGEHAEVNQLFKDKKLDKYCGDKGDATECVAVSAKDFYPAVVLGDFYDPSMTQDLLTALKRPAAPVYYMDDSPSPNTQYNALFDALRKIGSAEAASTVRTMWMGKDAATDTNIKILAISAYPFLARDTTGVKELGEIAGDNKADDQLRQEAATAYARLSRDVSAVGVLSGLADKYFKASDEKKKEAAGKPKADADAADKVFNTQKAALEKAQTDLVKLTNDKSKSIEEIKAATAAVTKMKDEFKAHKKKHRDASAPFKQLEGAAKAYKGYARMFQTHIARIEVASRCKQDLACYANTLKSTPDEAAKHNAPHIKDIKDWTDDEKKLLVEAAVERAMLEIGKAGDKGAAHVDALLDASKSDVRLIRQSVLLALPKIAKSPCAPCVTKLDAAIKAGEGKTTIGDLNLETTMLRNYFAGGKSMAAAPATPAAPAAPAAPAKADEKKDAEKDE